MDTLDVLHDGVRQDSLWVERLAPIDDLGDPGVRHFREYGYLRLPCRGELVGVLTFSQLVARAGQFDRTLHPLLLPRPVDHAGSSGPERFRFSTPRQEPIARGDAIGGIAF